jgi:hypothetical protein
MLNIGIAGNFVWLSFYQQYDRPTRSKHPSATGKISRRDTARRTANSGSRKTQPAARKR